MKQQFYIHTYIVECPCGLAVKCKCISLHQLQYCNIACVLDYNPFLYNGRCTIITVYYYKPIFYHERSKLLIDDDGKQITVRKKSYAVARRNYWPIIAVKTTVHTVIIITTIGEPV